ncbi:MAG: hypothetical protein HYV63_23810 [Candidatus Schekmanbacteria bacterium]|nr:hypothetical protein [Candidatus Schekmanbacteria bacterium]
MVTSTATPSITTPDWLVEAIVVARFWRMIGILDAIDESVRAPRGKAGDYEVCDYVLMLLAFSLSGHLHVRHFRKRLEGYEQALAAAWDREAVPSASALSRFLRVVGAPPLDETLGLLDRKGQRWLMFDTDGTRQAIRVRHLVDGEDRPPARRRSAWSFAPGYTGRKRGEAVRSRMVPQNAQTKEWLDSVLAPGNGALEDELSTCCGTIADYLDHHQIARSEGVVRLDGAHGFVKLIAAITAFGLGYLCRSADYRLVKSVAVRKAIAQGPTPDFRPHGEVTPRQVVDVGTITWRAGGRSPLVISTRLVVTIRDPGPEAAKRSKIGKRIGPKIYELFVTDRTVEQLSALDVVSLYLGRGDQERCFGSEDKQGDADRLVSTALCGQAFFAHVCLAALNARVRLGEEISEARRRRTEWSPADIVEVASESTDSLPAPLPEPSTEIEIAAGRGPSAEKLGGDDFEWIDESTVRCPAGNAMRPSTRTTSGDVEQARYTARRRDCRAFPLADRCLGSGSGRQSGRSITVRIRRTETMPQPGNGPQAESLLERIERPPVYWLDVPAAQMSGRLHQQLLGQTVTIEERLAEINPSPLNVVSLNRDQRAHRRLTWTERQQRNALVAKGRVRHVHLTGIPIPIQQMLQLHAA